MTNQLKAYERQLPKNWTVTSNNGTTLTAKNSYTGEVFNGTVADYNAIFKAPLPPREAEPVLANFNPLTGGLGISVGDDLLSIVVPKGGQDEIMAAQSWILARASGGVINLSPGQAYSITDTLTIDTQRIGIEGNLATLNAPNLSAGKTALYLTNLSGDVPSGEQFPGVKKISNLRLVGNTATSRDYDAIAIRANTDIAPLSVRVLLENINAHSFGKILSIGSRAYFVRGVGCEFYRAKFALFQESGAVDFAENVVFSSSTFFNSDCLLKDIGGQRWRFFGCSFDFHGDATGTRVTADDYIFDLQAGAGVELFGCHLEWAYGDAAGQTNSPIRLTGANTRFLMSGGRVYKGGGQAPLYPSLVSSNNQSQIITFNDVTFVKQGRSTEPLHDDALVTGSSAAHTGECGRVVVNNAMVLGTAPSDIPSVAGYTYNASQLRNGVDDPHLELAPRIAVTGSCVIANTATATDGSVTARGAAGKMLKITGQGKVILSFPIQAWGRRHAWSFFLNGGGAVGSVAIRERHSTVVQKWDGASTTTTSADTRNAYASITHTMTLAVNQWDRISWKNCNSSMSTSPRQNNAFFAVEIDTTLMSSGALYLDDAAFSLM